MSDHLSIIIPAYNVERYIEKTLLSVYNQSLPINNVIVINDGSTDKTGYIINDFIQKNKLKSWVLIHQDNQGVSKTSNTGISIASGKYILFLDGDDTISNNVSSAIYEHSSRNFDLLMWQFESSEIQSHPINDIDSNIDLLYRIYFKRESWIWIGATAYKREKISSNNISFTENCINGEDQEFFIKYTSHSNTFKFIEKIKSFHNHRPESISNTFDIKKFDSVFSIIRGIKYFLSIRKEADPSLLNSATYYEYHYFFKKSLRILFRKKETPFHSINKINKLLENNYTNNEIDHIKKLIAVNEPLKAMKNFLLNKTPYLYSYYIYLLSCKK